MYTGYHVETLSDEQFEQLANNKLNLELLPNQYLIAKNQDGEIKSKLRWTGEGFARLKYHKTKEFHPLTWKQECLADLLCNQDIPIKIIAGVAGSGKTRMSMYYGFHFLKKGLYQKMFLVRHNVSVGEKNGYLPGDKFEKIRGWLGFFEDNLDDTQDSIEDLINKELLEVDNVEYMKGRDLKNCWALVDEAEDLTEDQFKMLGERVSAGGVICFVGDYEQTTQEKYRKDSGLLRALKSLPGHPKVGVVVFDDKENDNVRSDVSKIFSYLY